MGSLVVACGIFPDQGSNPCPLHWQVDSQPLHHQGSPQDDFFISRIFNFNIAESLFFLAVPWGLWGLSSPTRDWTLALAVKVLSPNHWTSREFPCWVPFAMYPRITAWTFQGATLPITWVKKIWSMRWECDNHYRLFLRSLGRKWEVSG